MSIEINYPDQAEQRWNYAVLIFKYFCLVPAELSQIMSLIFCSNGEMWHKTIKDNLLQHNKRLNMEFQITLPKERLHYVLYQYLVKGSVLQWRGTLLAYCSSTSISFSTCLMKTWIRSLISTEFYWFHLCKWPLLSYFRGLKNMDHSGLSPQLTDAPIGKNLLLSFCDHTSQDATPQYNAESLLGTQSLSAPCSWGLFFRVLALKPLSYASYLGISLRPRKAATAQWREGKGLRYWKASFSTIRVVFSSS